MVEIHCRFIGYVPLAQLFEGVDTVNGIPISELIREVLIDAKQKELTAAAG